MSSPASALLDPAWRWTKAVAYSDTSVIPSRKEDILVRQASRYLKRLAKDDSVASQFLLETDYPGIHWAFKIWETDTGPRWYIEALVIAGETTENIAEYLGQELLTVKTYEALFFDVRSKLGHRGYILSQVLAQAVERGTFDREFDFHYKLLGLLLGPEGLKNYWNSGSLEDTVESQLKGVLRAKLLKDAVTAAHVRRINNFNSTEIINQFIELMTNETQADIEGQKKASVMAGLSSLLDSVSFNVRPVNAESDGASEPRIDKILAGQS